MADSPISALLIVASEVLGRAREDLEHDWESSSFVMLGGTSLRAAELVALAETRASQKLSLDGLLDDRPLAEVLNMATEFIPATPAEICSGDLRDLSAGQHAMVLAEQLFGGVSSHLLFSADIRGRLDHARMTGALGRLTRRHEALRTIFVRDGDEVRRRVLVSWQPRVVELTVPAGTSEPVSWAHSVLAPSSGTFLQPFEQPPVVFALARVSATRHVLSVLIHHGVTDGWSVGLLWRELAAGYQEAAAAEMRSEDPAPSIEGMVAAERSPEVYEAARIRAAALAAVPATLSIPSDLDRPEQASRAGARLPFTLTDRARAGCLELSKVCGVTRNTVLAAAWALVIARRTGSDDFLLGVASTGRRDAVSMEVMGLCVKTLPVHCSVTDGGSVRDYVSAMGTRLRDAMAFANIPCEYIVGELGYGGELSRNPLVQVMFAAHDELIPARLTMADLDVELHEGYCGGTAFDAVLYLQRWDPAARLALEYSPTVLGPDEASALAEAVNHALDELARDPDQLLHEVRTITPSQRELLSRWGQGPVADAETGVWQLVEEAAARYPERIAVRDSDPRGTLTYQQLLDAVVAHSSALAAAGVAEEDRVAFAGARSAREIVSLLAILRLGASYVGIDPLAPQEVVAAMLGLVNPRVVVGDAAAIGKLGPAIGGYRTLECTDPSTAENGQAPPAAVPDPSRIAYIAFSSGSTGRPKGIMVPHRAVVRLVRDPQYLRAGAAERFLRLAPLAFDASTLEIFAPLAAGGTIEIYPPQDVTPAALAAFAHQRRLTGMWLTAGLFRVIADHRPDAFTGLRQLLTGGDIVPSSQVRRVLQRCPGLRVTNGYGPTENTTFTTVHHVDDPAELKGAVPVGQPVPGTSVLIVDRSGKLVPPGGIGELYVYGTGLALGYLGLQAETAASFGYLTSETNDVVYRTGDVVRWDHAGRLEFLGRRDHQVKIRGFRIELDAITDLVREHPAVRDAVVVATLSDVSDRRLLAAVVAEPAPGLVAELRRFASARLPAYAVPSLWVITDPLPVTANGKLDAARLERLALGGREEQPQSAAAILAGAQPAAEPDTLEAAISRIWQRVLGNETFNPDARFFDVGGDSIRLLRVHAQLAKLVPGTELHIGDLYKFPTIRALARHLGSQASSLRGSGEDDPLAIIQHNVLAVRNNPRWAEMTQICVRQDRKGRAWQQFLHHAIHDLCPLVRS